jgi:hypothetical protein
VPPPPPPTGQIYVLKIAQAAKAPSSQKQSPQNIAVEPPGQYWPFQDQTTTIAAQVISKLNESGLSTQTGFGEMLGRMIRAALLDKTIYREVAADPSLQNEAWKVTALIIVFSSIGFSLLSFSFMSLPGLMSLGSTAVIQLVAWLARVWIVQMAASTWLQKQATFEQLFRSLAYAQSPAILQIVPVVGQIAGLWSLVTTTAAIRDVTGCDTWNAAILAVIGVVGVMVAAAFASPIVLGLLG